MEDKKQFIIEECMLFSVQAGLQTRNKNYPIYNKLPDAITGRHEIKYQYDNTSNLKWQIFEFLDKYMIEIQSKGISEMAHISKIKEMANTLSEKFKPVLFQERFRIGVSQKIINLFLKYMWSLNEIPEPCHCPVDGIIKDKIQRKMLGIELVDWTQMDDMFDYMKYIDVIRQFSVFENRSIAQWELNNWGRR
jgi:hypothetical protein